MKISILCLSRFNDETNMLLDKSFDVTNCTNPMEIESLAIAPQVRGIAATGDVVIDEQLLSKLPRLEIVSLFGAGYEGMDLEAARKRGITVSNTPDVLTADVADLAIALWICVSRRILVADQYLRSGLWKSKGPPPLATTASGRRAGILGFGRIGSAIAKRCLAMDMTVDYHSRRPRNESCYRFQPNLGAMVDDIDVLFVACPGGSVTRHLVSSRIIERLGAKGTLINVSRGSVVDQQALVSALIGGRLGGAGLDVFEAEPDAPSELISLPNVVLTPHIGSATVETRKAMIGQMVENLREHFAGGHLSNRLT
jgi:hydroxypyruvate reductase